jgi:hypothetical protein
MECWLGPPIVSGARWYVMTGTTMLTMSARPDSPDA